MALTAEDKKTYEEIMSSDIKALDTKNLRCRVVLELLKWPGPRDVYAPLLNKHVELCDTLLGFQKTNKTEDPKEMLKEMKKVVEDESTLEAIDNFISQL